MTNTYNDDQNSDSSPWTHILDQAPDIAPTLVKYSSVNTPG